MKNNSKNTKRTLLKVREILLNEMSKSYYRNPINIKEEHIIKEEPLYDSETEYTSIEKMRIFDNDFYDFITTKVQVQNIKTLKK